MSSAHLRIQCSKVESSPQGGMNAHFVHDCDSCNDVQFQRESAHSESIVLCDIILRDIVLLKHSLACEWHALAKIRPAGLLHDGRERDIGAMRLLSQLYLIVDAEKVRDAGEKTSSQKVRSCLVWVENIVWFCVIENKVRTIFLRYGTRQLRHIVINIPKAIENTSVVMTDLVGGDAHVAVSLVTDKHGTLGRLLILSILRVSKGHLQSRLSG